MAKLKVNCKDSQILVKSRLDGMEQINQKEMMLFQSKLIRGLMRPNVMDAGKIVYSAPGGIVLSRFLQMGISKNDFYLIIAQLVETVKKIENNGLTPNNLILDLQYTFINEYTKEVHFIYQPIISPNMYANIFVFLYDLVRDAVFRIPMEVKCANDMTIFMQKQQVFSPGIFEKYLMKVYPDVYKQIQRQKPGQSRVLSTKSWSEEDSYVEKEDEFMETSLLEEDEEDTTFLEDEEGTTLLDDEEGTTVLDPEVVITAYILRTGTMEQADIDKSPFRIGKERKNVDFYVQNNSAVSRVHADILKKGDSYYIRDNNSTNKTYVNGKKVELDEEVELSDEDKITLANEEFEFHIEESQR